MNKLFDKRDWEFKSAVGELSVKGNWWINRQNGRNSGNT